MRRFSAFLILICCAFVAPSAAKHRGQNSRPPQGAAREETHHSFGAEAFDRFHDILHPLQHEALPREDYKTIRARAAELVRAGQLITRRAAPRGLADAAMFKKKRKEFAQALARFKTSAARGTDAQLKTSYVAVHDSFEELADMLPRR